MTRSWGQNSSTEKPGGFSEKPWISRGFLLWTSEQKWVTACFERRLSPISLSQHVAPYHQKLHIRQGLSFFQNIARMEVSLSGWTIRMRPPLLFRAASRPGSTQPVPSPRKSRGFTLLELMIALGVMAVLTTSGIVAYRSYQGREDTTRAVESTRQLSNSLMQTYGQTGSFASLSDTDVINGNLKPMTLSDKGGKIMNKWGGTVDVAPSTATNRAFAVTWNKVPSGACSGMSSQLSRDFSTVKVNGSVVKSDTKALDIGQTASMCGGNDDNSVELTSTVVAPQDGIGALPDPVGAGASVPALPTAPPGKFADATSKVDLTMVAKNTFSMPSTPAVSSSAASMVGNAVPLPNYIDMPAAAPSAAQSNPCGSRLPLVNPTPQVNYQWVNVNPGCPTGYVGSHTYQQQQSQSRTATCPVPLAEQDPTWGAWSAWANTAMTQNDVNTCATTCNTRLTSTLPANVWKPSPAYQYQWVTVSVSCPAGYSGTHTYQVQQQSSRSASCANPNVAADPTWSAWSAWSNTGATQADYNTCAANCVAPGPTQATYYQWVVQNVGCPAGYTGTHTYQQQQYITYTTYYYCPAVTGAYAVYTQTNTGWQWTSATQADSNTCHVACATPATVSVTSNLLCIAGTCINNPGGIYNRTVSGSGFTLVEARVNMTWNGVGYAAIYSCSLAPNTGNTCTLALSSGSLPPGISWGGIGAVSSSSSTSRNYQVGASIGSRACP
jgi:prepilin-type N-terminal cleavage/methylation domain-containing protein